MTTPASPRPQLPQAVRLALVAPLTAAFFGALPPVATRGAVVAFLDAVTDGCIRDVYAIAHAIVLVRLGPALRLDDVEVAAARATLLYVRALDVAVDGEPVAAIERVTFERRHVERMSRHGVPVSLQQRLMLHRTEVAA